MIPVQTVAKAAYVLISDTGQLVHFVPPVNAMSIRRDRAHHFWLTRFFGSENVGLWVDVTDFSRHLHGRHVRRSAPSGDGCESPCRG